MVLRMALSAWLAAVLIACAVVSVVVLARDFPLTPAQKHFTAIVGGLPGVVHTEWRSPVSLYVSASAQAVGNPPDKRLARTLAETLAERGRTALRQPFCVHIVGGRDGRTLAKSCVYE